MTQTDKIWPSNNLTEVPYAVYEDEQIYARERERIFQGPTWNILGLECEVPEAGDYKTTFLGDIPIVVVRGQDGALRGFENRCAHRGALLCLEKFGKTKVFTCAYHAWSYDYDGNLVGVAFQNGVQGQGGMPDDFRREDHGLRRVKIAVLAGLIFGSFDPDVQDLEHYLGPEHVRHIHRVLPKSPKVLGYYTQTMQNNWKLYAENVRDPYHASILHLFFTTFRVNRLSQKGGILVSEGGGNHISYSKLDPSGDDREYDKEKLRADSKFGLKASALLGGIDEFNDGITIQILSVFPNLVIQQVFNSLVVRQIVPRGVDTADILWTTYGFADDDDAMSEMRQLHSNYVGPAGYISMEDGAVGNFIQRALPGTAGMTSVVKMGGADAASMESRATETSIRGFWKAYRHHMGL